MTAKPPSKFAMLVGHVTTLARRLRVADHRLHAVEERLASLDGGPASAAAKVAAERRAEAEVRR